MTARIINNNVIINPSWTKSQRFPKREYRHFGVKKTLKNPLWISFPPPPLPPPSPTPRFFSWSVYENHVEVDRELLSHVVSIIIIHH